MTHQRFFILFVALTGLALAACAAPLAETPTPTRAGKPVAIVTQPAATEDDWSRGPGCRRDPGRQPAWTTRRSTCTTKTSSRMGSTSP